MSCLMEENIKIKDGQDSMVVNHTLAERVTERRARYVVFAPAKAVCLVAPQPFNQF